MSTIPQSSSSPLGGSSESFATMARMATGLDPRQLHLPDLPPDWEYIDPEILEQLKPDAYGLQSPEQLVLEEEIYSKRWFIVKNSWGFRCKRCRSGELITPGSMPGTIHKHITYACVERPFNGLNEVLMFQKVQMGRSETNLDSYTMRLGEAIEPISPAEASEKYLKIQMKTGRDLAWSDFRARYLRRYKDYLRSLGWSVEHVTIDQWKLVHLAAQRAYDLGEGR